MRAKGFAALVALAAGGWYLARGGGQDLDAGWAEARRSDLVLGVEVTGTLAAVESNFIGPPPIPDVWDFKISMLAPEGKDVKRGEPVLAFDASELQKQLDLKLAERDAARKRIEEKQMNVALARERDRLRLAEAEARRRKARLKVDVPEEMAKAKELERARLELEEAEREIAFVRAAIAAAREADEAALASLREERDAADRRVREIRFAIEQMTVRAPRDGTVIYVADWREEKKKVGDSVWRGQKVLEIPDLRRMKARGEVDEADAGRVRPGQRVLLRLDAHPEMEFTGKVSSVWNVFERKSWREPQKVMRLEIELDRTDPERMRPGMRFRGTIETERIPGVLLVPVQAVFPGREGPFAYKKTWLGWKKVRLETGRRNDREVEVRSGLAEGDRVAQRDLEATRRRRG